MRVCVILGTRADAVMLAPVVHELDAVPGAATTVVSTGQNRQRLEQALSAFGIEPDVELDPMRPAPLPAGPASRLVADLGNVLTQLAPDRVLVQGDTATALCGALAAYHAAIPVGPVDAGRRTADPAGATADGGGRRLAWVIADRHYARTQRTADGLLAEGVPSASIVVTGSTAIDSLLWAARRSPGVPLSAPRARLRRVLVKLKGLGAQPEALRGICAAIRELTAIRDVEVVVPEHRSPAGQAVLRDALDGAPGVHLVGQLGYLELAAELVACDLVLTDSGAMQEDGPAVNTPVLVVGDATDRPEAVERGAARLVGLEPAGIVDEVTRLLDCRIAHRAMAAVENPYGDGTAARRIVDDLIGIDSPLRLPEALPAPA